MLLEGLIRRGAGGVEALRTQPVPGVDHDHLRISAARARGQLRLVEMNQQILGNLDRVIATLDADDEPEATADAS